MGCVDCVIELIKIKLLTSLTMLIVHAVNGLSSTLLESEHVRWGLYKWCSVEEGNDTQCHQIHPGESPAYVEVARFSAAFSVVMIFLNFPIILWVPSEHAICKLLLKVVITLLPSLNVGTTLVLVAAYRKDDDRWKDSNPSLTGSFDVTVVFAVLDLIPTCFFFFLYACSLGVVTVEQQKCCQRLNSARIKASILWKHLYRKLVTAMKPLKASICGKRLSRKPAMTMKRLKASICGKHLSRKLVIAMKCLMTSIFGKRLSRKLVIITKRLEPGTVQDLPNSPLRHQPGQPEGHGSPPIRHAPGGPAGDLPPGIDQNDASGTSSVRTGHSEGTAGYNAANAYRSWGTAVHQTAGQGEISRYTTMDSVILHGAPPERSGRSVAMVPVISQGGQEELSRSHTARDVPRVHSICRPQLTLAGFQSFLDPRTNRLIFQLRRQARIHPPGHTSEECPHQHTSLKNPPTRTYI